MKSTSWITILLTSLCLTVSCASSKKKADAEMEKGETAKAEMKKDGEMAKAKMKEGKVDKTKAREKVMKESAEGTLVMTCENGQDIRKLYKADEQSGGCAVEYEKFNKVKEIGRADADTSWCDSLIDRVSNNLKNAGFSCS